MTDFNTQVMEYFRSFLMKNIADKNKKVITESDIEQKICVLSKIVETGTFGILAGLSSDVVIEKREFTEKEKKLLKRYIETQVNVKMDVCKILEGEEQRKRDKSWWTNKKDKTDLFYWNNYESQLKFPPHVKRTLDTDSDLILNNLFDPTIAQSEKRYGMVVGQVQSGKTANYAGLLCKAADAQYKCIIVIAGIHNCLRDQTQRRIEAIFKNTKLKLEKEPRFLTTAKSDFNKNDASKNSTTSFENTKTPIFMVIKKNQNTLKNVLDWLNEKYPTQSEAPVLLIDDEADNASINTKEAGDPTVINMLIRKILSKFTKFSYIGYTATPFANIFIDDEAKEDSVGDDLFPKDFIVTLDAPDNYCGARKYFLEPNSSIIEVNDFHSHVKINAKSKSVSKSSIKMDKLPPSLKEAIRCYFINLSIMANRCLNIDKTSMLVHVNRLTMAHQTFASYVDNYVSQIKNHIELYGKMENALDDPLIADIKNTFDKRYSNLETPCDWSDVLEGINKIYSSIRVVEVHSKSKDDVSFSDDDAKEIKRYIVVGGNSLSRGFTLEGLNVSYFVRETSAADTLMQMARWFGYRTDYEDICKIYITNRIRKNFEEVAESTFDLFDQINQMRIEGKTPKEFGLAVKRSPGSFLITARNKMKNTEELTIEVCLDGHSKEESWIPMDKQVNLDNLEKMKNFVNTLGGVYKMDYPDKYKFENIESAKISCFLKDFIFLDDYYHLPISGIKSYLAKYPDVNWDVVLVGVKNPEKIEFPYDLMVGVQEREIHIRERCEGNCYEVPSRQLTTAVAERYAVSKEIIEKELIQKGKPINRENVRLLLKNPVMMLHLIRNSSSEVQCDYILPTVSFIFPKSTEERTKTVIVTANKVYMREMYRKNEQDYGEENE